MRQEAKRRRAFGRIQKLPSGRYRARYTCPNCAPRGQVLHAAGVTFTSKTDASGWLTTVQADLVRAKQLGETFRCGAMQEQDAERARKQRNTFRDYAEAWLARRSNPAAGKPLTMRTAGEYRRQIDELVETFGDAPIEGITRVMVRTWWEDDLPAKYPKGRPTGNAHVYALLRTILNDAVDRELIDANPCTIKGAGQTKRRKVIRPAEVGQLAAIADADAMPPRYRAAILLAGWCSLRFGEVAELRRRDVAEDGSAVTVSRGMTYSARRYVVGTPKADSKRKVNVPPHLRRVLLDHISEHAQQGADGLLFWREHGHTGSCECGHRGCVGGHIFSQWFDRYFRPAAEAAGRADLTFHELRHTGNVLAAQAGASLAEQMARMGHSTYQAALRYQHEADGRGAEIAERLSDLAMPKKVNKKGKRKLSAAG